MTRTQYLFAFFAIIAGQARCEPVSFSIDPAHSMPRFSYNHFGFSNQLARFDKMSGKIQLDFDKHEGSMDISVDASSIDTGNTLLNSHLKAGDFFDVGSYPVATFKSTNIAFEGDRPSAIAGNLTIHGVTQPVTLNVNSFKHGPHGNLQNREAVGGTASASISRTAFGLGRYAPNVGDDVILTISLEAIRD